MIDLIYACLSASLNSLNISGLTNLLHIFGLVNLLRISGLGKLLHISGLVNSMHMHMTCQKVYHSHIFGVYMAYCV